VTGHPQPNAFQKSKREKKKLGLNISLASCQNASETVVLFENTD